MRGPTWTAAETAYVSANAGVLPWREVAEHLDRPLGAVHQKASKLGLVGRQRWTIVPAQGEQRCGGIGCDVVFQRYAANTRFCSQACRNTGAVLRHYHLTRERWDSILAEQGGECPCGAVPDSWRVDHDHRCCPQRKRSCGKCVRGLICNRCNLGLGLFGDSLAVLRRLVAYLERYEESVIDR